MTRTDIEAVVRGLSGNARKLLEISGGGGPVEVNDSAAIEELGRLGLLSSGLSVNWLSPRGQQVANHLKATQEDQPC